MTFTLPPRPYPEEAYAVQQMIEDLRVAEWRKERPRYRPVKLDDRQRSQIARSSKPRRELAERYGISEDYVTVLRSKHKRLAA
jgi:hypothetical protein